VPLSSLFPDGYFLTDVQGVLVDIEDVCPIFENFTGVMPQNVATRKTEHLLPGRVDVDDFIPHVKDEYRVAHALDHRLKGIGRAFKQVMPVDTPGESEAGYGKCKGRQVDVVNKI